MYQSWWENLSVKQVKGCFKMLQLMSWWPAKNIYSWHIVRIEIKHQAKQAKLSNQIYQNKSKTHMHQWNRSSVIIKVSLFELFACWVNLHVLFIVCWLFTKSKFLKNSFSTIGVLVRILRSGHEVINFFHSQLNWARNLSCSSMLKCQQMLAF